MSLRTPHHYHDVNGYAACLVVDIDTVSPPPANALLRWGYLYEYEALTATVWLHPCESGDGGFWVDSPEFPGLITQGDTEADALAMAREAGLGLLESYQARGEPVPWRCEHEKAPDDVLVRRVQIATNPVEFATTVGDIEHRFHDAEEAFGGIYGTHWYETVPSLCP